MSANNQVTLVGRLTRDPEVDEVGKDKKYTKAKLSIAVKNINKKKNEDGVDADFIDGIVAWGNQAKFAEKYLTKGRMILIHGELLPEKWKDKDDKNHYKLTIRASSIVSLDSKKEED